MRRTGLWMLIACLTVLPGGAARAQAVPETFVSFDEFVEGVAAARDDSAAGARPEFERMRQHIVELYHGVEARHSFLLEGQYFDCVPVEQQPSVRLLGLETVQLTPPEPATGAPAGAGPGGRGAASPLTLGLTDPFGHAVHCDAGTIPLRRITLDEISRFGSLRAFLRKTPFGTSTTQDPHKYAFATQPVKNFGGSSWLSLWSPIVKPGIGQFFSLSQQWYAGGDGNKYQTVEGGWQTYPAKYHTPKSVLFIYWTPDNYRTGCHNLECAGFVQTNNDWPLGGAWPTYSAKGGPQYEIQMQWKLTGGKWWLYLRGAGSFEAVGYYPASIYKGGQLSRWATEITYGGETLATTLWPPMGSGAFASKGAGQAAYQRRIYYIDGPASSRWGKLAANQPSPKCYTLKLTPSSPGASWGTYFYFGGPGGRSC
jgi:Neprosin